MAILVITVIGDDRPGLVSALADVVADHSGSWGHSQLARLAGTFAGIVTVQVPQAQADALAGAIGALSGVLETTVRVAPEGTLESGTEGGDAIPVGADQDAGSSVVFHLDLIGNDRPGIVREISGVLAAHGVSVEDLQTKVVPAPQAGGELFAARALLRAPGHTDVPVLREALERLAGELLVDISFDPQDATEWE